MVMNLVNEDDKTAGTTLSKPSDCVNGTCSHDRFYRHHRLVNGSSHSSHEPLTMTTGFPRPFLPSEIE
ncbi:hypothetical protein TNCV_4600701 [Trichonephila clavipes]|nr:hypothetical protein TNCV_4600701 [Trichonephila clavipes]